MLALNANREQMQLFNQILQKIDAQVVWNGHFVVMGDRLIMEGFVRSLLFHFDIQKTETLLIDLDVDEDDVLELEQHPQIQDFITMAVYVFEKWGCLKDCCINIEQDIPQLHQLFNELLSEYQLSAVFDENSLQFYKDGVRITYEDVLETVLAYEKRSQTDWDIILPKTRLKLPVLEPDRSETASINTSHVHTPDAAAKPETAAVRENQIIQQIEKYHARLGVLDRLSEIQRKALRRDITYDKLLDDKDKEELLFPIDDYEKQLFGKTAPGSPGSNTAGIPGRGTETAAARETQKNQQIEKYHARLGVLDRLSEIQRKALRRDITYDKLLDDKDKEELLFPIDDYEKQLFGKTASGVHGIENGAVTAASQSASAGTSQVPVRDSAAAAARIEKYHTRISVLDRLSVMQRKALIRDITYDRLLDETEKNELLYPIHDYEYQEKMQEIDAEFEDVNNRTYAYVQKVIKKAAREDISETLKTAVLEKLHKLSMQWGAREVKQIMDQTPMYVERGEYQELKEKLSLYDGVDLSPYQERLRQMKETLEIKEISNMLAQSPKKSRADFMQLLRQIEAQGFAKENASTYVDSILGWVHDIDEAKIKRLFINADTMDFDTAASLYEQIQRGNFLPDIKAAAIEKLSERLRKIRMDECSILAYSLWLNLPDEIRKNPRYHFCPSQKIVRQITEAEERKLIDNALFAYTKERGIFEYPIVVIDTSKDGNGEDGMLLTPENLFYGIRSSGYKVPLSAIKSIQITSGLLNHRLIMEETNGVRHKLPYTVGTEELPVWVDILEKFIRYLKQKPVSDKLVYKEPAQGEIQCKRCGCVYTSQNICPECGYKNEI